MSPHSLGTSFILTTGMSSRERARFLRLARTTLSYPLRLDFSTTRADGRRYAFHSDATPAPSVRCCILDGLAPWSAPQTEHTQEYDDKLRLTLAAAACRRTVSEMFNPFAARVLPSVDYFAWLNPVKRGHRVDQMLGKVASLATLKLAEAGSTDL